MDWLLKQFPKSMLKWRFQEPSSVLNVRVVKQLLLHLLNSENKYYTLFYHSSLFIWLYDLPFIGGKWYDRNFIMTNLYSMIPGHVLGKYNIILYDIV